MFSDLTPSEQYDLEIDTDAIIEACGSERAAIRALLVANSFLEDQLVLAQSKSSTGYQRKGVGSPKTKAS